MAVVYDLPSYYREREGADTLSRTFQSTELLTPLQTPQRPTVSPERYEQYLQNTPAIPRLPWGKEREYGGTEPISLPDDHRPKREPPPAVTKGHMHHGYGGDPWPRSVPIESYYDITQLKRSKLRPTDDLLPKPQEAAIMEKQIYQKFPAEHPYQSHISKFALFPSFRSPDDPDTGVRASTAAPLHPHTPAKGHDAIILKKTSGNAFRHEVIKIPLESMKKALHWPGQHGYFHIPKFRSGNEQVYYPKPLKTIAPNPTLRPLEETLSERAANVQRNVEKALWLSTYKQSFTGRGPMNPLQLDDYHEKLIGKLTGAVDENTELKEKYMSTFLPARPLEGRKARLLQERRPLKVPDWELQSEKTLEKGVGSAIGINLPGYSEEHDNVEGNRIIYQNPQNRDPRDHVKHEGVEYNTHYSTYDLNQALENARARGNMHIRNKSSEININPKPPHFQKITDTCVNEALYNRQLTVSRECSPEPACPMHYEDLPPSNKDHNTVWGNPLSINKPVLQGDLSSKEMNIEESVVNRRRIASAPPRGRTVSCTKRQTRPQTALQDLQDSFSKSEAHKRFHETFPKKGKDLRENSCSGKRHTFYGFNSFYFH